jgi:hypothetical protein
VVDFRARRFLDKLSMTKEENQKMATPKQLAANRRNAQKSTGPKTTTGKSVAKLNALKHGILAGDVVVTGRFFEEDANAYNRLRRELWESLAPVGVAEEILVDRIAVCAWRFRRALKAEQGEILLSTDVKTLSRMQTRHTMGELAVKHGLTGAMMTTAGTAHILQMLTRLRQQVQADGELTDAALQEAIAEVAGPDVPLMRELARLRTLLGNKPNGIEATEWKARQCRHVVEYLDQQCRKFDSVREDLAEDESEETQARLTAATLPSPEILDKILRYETTLERQLYRAMNQLERLQRRRQGEDIPAPMTMDIGPR